MAAPLWAPPCWYYATLAFDARRAALHSSVHPILVTGREAQTAPARHAVWVISTSERLPRVVTDIVVFPLSEGPAPGATECIHVSIDGGPSREVALPAALWSALRASPLSIAAQTAPVVTTRTPQYVHASLSFGRDVAGIFATWSRPLTATAVNAYHCIFSYEDCPLIRINVRVPTAAAAAPPPGTDNRHEYVHVSCPVHACPALPVRLLEVHPGIVLPYTATHAVLPVAPIAPGVHYTISSAHARAPISSFSPLKLWFSDFTHDSVLASVSKWGTPACDELRQFGLELRLLLSRNFELARHFSFSVPVGLTDMPVIPPPPKLFHVALPDGFVCDAVVREAIVDHLSEHVSAVVVADGTVTTAPAAADPAHPRARILLYIGSDTDIEQCVRTVSRAADAALTESIISLDPFNGILGGVHVGCDGIVMCTNTASKEAVRLAIAMCDRWREAYARALEALRVRDPGEGTVCRVSPPNPRENAYLTRWLRTPWPIEPAALCVSYDRPRDDVCCICTDAFADCALHACDNNHTVHTDCYTTMRTTSGQKCCPACRADGMAPVAGMDAVTDWVVQQVRDGVTRIATNASDHLVAVVCERLLAVRVLPAHRFTPPPQGKTPPYQNLKDLFVAIMDQECVTLPNSAVLAVGESRRDALTKITPCMPCNVPLMMHPPKVLRVCCVYPRE